jgi:hypothetical protein
MKNQINNIIKEEVQNFINEGTVVENDNFKFKSEIRYPDVKFYDYESFTKDYDAQIIDAIIVVSWKVKFWVNNFGIENIFVDIINIDGTYMLELRDKQSDEIKQEIQKDINDIKWKFIVPENVPLVTNGQLYIKNLKFNFKNNVCEVIF